MYKVFYYNKVVFLTGKENNNFPDNVIYHTFHSKKQLKDIVSSFFYDDKYGVCVVSHDDTKELFEIFSSFFKLVEAAGGLVFNEKDQLLAIRRRDKWDFPKGKREHGERIPETAIREVKEECNLDEVEIISKLKETYHIYPLKGEEVLKTTYWYKMVSHSSENIKPQYKEDITEVKWVSGDQVNEIMDDTFESLKDLIRDIC